MELLIVVMIITLVMSIGGNAYRDQQKHVNYNNAVFKVSDMIKTARNYAVTSRSVYDTCEILEDDRAYVPAEGYGVYIYRSDTPGESRAVLFANTKKDTEIETNQFDGGAPCTGSDWLRKFLLFPEMLILSAYLLINLPTTRILTLELEALERVMRLSLFSDLL